MKRILLLAIALCIVPWVLPVPAYSAEGPESEPVHSVLKYQGAEREYFVYLPASLKRNAPLVIVLHGYGGTAMRGGQKLCEVADREGFAVCYPQGAVDGKGKTCWNVGYPFQKGLETDDAGFLMKLARHLQKEYSLSRDNVFLTGMSNGGEMCYLMAYLHPEFFRAIAPIAGLTLEWMQKDLDSRGSVPLMEVHGTADRTSAWEGDPTDAGGWGEYISVPMAVAKWAVEARCTDEVREVLPLKGPGESGKAANRVILHRYVGGVPAWKGGPDTEVWLYEVIGGTHSWAENDMDTCREIWRFFSKWLK
jgi:polyhydroxybutyrate depolymerase